MASYKYRGTSVSDMARGFSGMLSYYAFIGILLGIFALCCGGPLLIARLLEGDDQQSTTTDTHYQADKNTPEWLRPYVGSYDRHGQSLDIAPDGQGLFRSRTYTTCDQDPREPCEKEPGDMPIRTEFTVVQSGGAVVGRTAAGDSPLNLIKPGILEFEGLTYCESDVVDAEDPAIEACGA